MPLLSPKLRNLNKWINDGKSKTDDVPNEVWEIDVPGKESLQWSIVLSVLLLDRDGDLSSLRKLTGSEGELDENQGKRKLTEEIVPEDINVFLSEFNPFKSKDASFMRSPKISEVVRIFDQRLNRYANKIKAEGDVWDDDLKLKAAAQLLKISINVYFPAHIEAQRYKIYADTASNTKTSIILFQYESKKSNSKEDTENVFHFAVSQKCASHLKSDNSETKSNDHNLNRRESHMFLLAPKLRNLHEWIKNENSRTNNIPKEVWEIGVPAKKSLYWSIVLSVLLLDPDENLASPLRKLIGSGKELKEIKEKKGLKETVTSNDIEILLSKFNPFINRFTSFIQSPKIGEIVRIFGCRLKRYAKKNLKKNIVGDIWNDDLKLKAAAQLLKTTIDVYFPDDIEVRKFKNFVGTASYNKTNIILFQYENKEHKSREETLNVFYFAMSQKYAHNLKLNALNHILKKAKVKSLPRKVQNLMNDSGAHGQAFLPTILKSNCIDVLPEIYKSPYVAFKLSEIGFETNPIAGIKDNLSALCYASGKIDPRYLRILYDYTSNCRHLFDRSARRADDEVLENLKQIKITIQRDITEVQRVLEDPIVEINVLNQIKKFVTYQIEVANAVKKLNCSKSNINEFQFWKSIIILILEHYLNYFYYESVNSEEIYFQLNDYWSFSEYYEYTDNFSFLSFFDNFFKFRICCGLREENVVLNTEWQMFLAMMSNKYFPKFFGKNALVDRHNAEDCEENILTYIPLFYRNILNEEIKRFLRIIKHSPDSKSLKEEVLVKDSVSVSQIVDELIIQRLNKYVEAVIEISPGSDEIKAVLVIERALQVLGESVKPPSSKTSIVSFLLRSCLEQDLQFDLIRIRNTISTFLDNAFYGRYKTEEDYQFFERIKEEFKSIKEVFQIVNFTQRFRIKESLMNFALPELEKEMDLHSYEKLKKKCKFYENQKIKKYEKYYDKCIKLLHDSFTDLKESSKRPLNSERIIYRTQEIFGQLKSIEYLINSIKKIKHESYLEDFTLDIQHFIEENVKADKLVMEAEEVKDNDEQQILTQIIKKLNPLLIKCINVIEKNNSVQQVKMSAPHIGKFFKRLRENMFSSQEIQETLEAIKAAVTEAQEAKKEVKQIFQKKLYESKEKLDDLLIKILISINKLPKIRKCFQDRDGKLALKYLKRNVSENLIGKYIIDMLETDSVISGYALSLVTKIVFQRHLSSKIYTSVSLPAETYRKLEFFLTKKAKFLLMRLKSLKDILIEEDEEIRGTYKLRRNEPIKYHLKFLMRQRYQKEKTICASLEMAYFDCMNIFYQQSKDGDLSSDGCLRSFYEKSSDLYTGINLRNIVSHRQNIPETVGNILDENDFPSEMIDKMYRLISDTEAIEAILELFQMAGVFVEEDFITAVENDGFGEHNSLTVEIKECPRWKDYLFLCPFLRT